MSLRLVPRDLGAERLQVLLLQRRDWVRT